MMKYSILIVILNFLTQLDGSTYTLAASETKGAIVVFNRKNVAQFTENTLGEIKANISALKVIESKTKRIAKNAFIGYSNLHNLTFVDNKIKVLEEGCFNGLENLVNLNLSRNGIRKVQPGFFPSNTTLTSIDLSYNNLSVLPDEIFKNYTALKYLNLEHNLIECFSFKLIENIQYATLAYNNITDLKMQSDRWSISHDMVKYGISYKFNNYYVDLSFNLIENLDGTLYLPIKELNLANNVIKEIHGGFFKNQFRMKVLNLSRNFITSLKEDCFLGLRNLEDLDLSHNRIHSMYVNTFKNTPHIFRLNLYNNNITNLNPMDILQMKKLIVVNLGHNDIKGNIIFYLKLYVDEVIWEPTTKGTAFGLWTFIHNNLYLLMFAVLVCLLSVVIAVLIWLCKSTRGHFFGSGSDEDLTAQSNMNLLEYSRN